MVAGFDPPKRRGDPPRPPWGFPFFTLEEDPAARPPVEPPTPLRSLEDPRASGAPRAGPVGYYRYPFAPDRSGSPGLYDLPGLLARIWSVPAAQRAAAGAYSLVRPEPPGPVTPAELETPLPRRETLPPAGAPAWRYLPLETEPSLPLAAVPSLTLAPSPPEPTPPRELVPRSLPTGRDPLVQYIAWKHPPCHRAFEPRPGRGAGCPWCYSLAQTAHVHGGREEVSPSETHAPLIRPAPPWWVTQHLPPPAIAAA